MSNLQRRKIKVEIPPKLIPVFTKSALYRCAYGGRGSAKTRTFAKMAALKAYQLSKAGKRGLIVCAREFMNSLADSSFAEVREAILSEPWLAKHFDIGDRYIRTIDKRIDFAFIGLRHNLDSIKSKSKIYILWVDEAEPVSEIAWEKADPTVREEGSEIWVTWNPERKVSATHKRFRENPPENCICVEMNWRDNPWFDKTTLPAKRLSDQKRRPDQYEHIWEGGFRNIIEGAYFAESLRLAREEGRISKVSLDPHMTIRLFADIGGTGAKADNFVFWVAQFVGLEIRVIDHYEVQGQPIGHHLNWLRTRKYTPEKAQIWLPHDGASNDKVYDVSYETAFKKAGYEVTVVPNQGRGAAMARVEEVRHLFSSIWINEERCKPGLDALGWYHSKKSDDEREMDLGPEHDWSSHSADAFGLMCIAYEPPTKPLQYKEPNLNYGASGGWMS